MRKQLTRFLSVLILLAVVVSAIGCGKDKGIDETKTQLYVYNYDGGVGSEWLDAAAKRFSEKYAETEFEPGTGKKGVEFILGKGKDALNTIATSEYNVVFNERVYYNDFISQGLLLDISDVVGETLEDVTDGTEKGKIIDKMTSEQISAFTALDGKHYVLPHYEVYTGIVYDRKVFADHSLFYKQGGGWTKDANKTVGPDGVKDTYDDGLPSSYEEFYKVIDRMTQLSTVPFIWSGQYPTYTNDVLGGLWASMSGKDAFSLNFNLGSGAQSASAKIVDGFDAIGNPNIGAQTITPQNGYLMSRDASKYYAYSFLQKIQSNSSYYSDKITEVLTHLDTQMEYIYSDLENNPIAMMIEGSYWYNEASDSLKRSENTYKDRAKNRNFAWMPLPRQISGSVTEGNGVKNTLLDTLGSFGFINANIKEDANKVALAKKFLKFCYTDASLNEFTALTGIPKAARYALEDGVRNGLDNYQRSLFEIREASDVVYPYSANKIFINSQSSFSFAADSSIWDSTVGNIPYKAPITAFKAKISAKDYFTGGFVTQSAWERKYGQWFD